MEERFKKVENGVKKILKILGCRHDDVTTGSAGPSSSHTTEASTSGRGVDRDDDDDGDDERCLAFSSAL